jgi:outer membrane lipoprotein-sorting protein
MIFRLGISIALLASGFLSSCISRTTHLAQDQIPLRADTIAKSELLKKLTTSSLAIKTLYVQKSTLKVSRMVSNETIKSYHDVTGKIAVDRPGRLRLEIEKFTTLALMVSDGKQYRVSVPTEAKFGVGDVSAPVRGAEFPYNLRPSHILDALFVDGEQYVGKPGIDSYVFVVTEPKPDGLHSYYIVFFGKIGGLPLERLTFDRTLGVEEVVEKVSYLPDGEIEADIQYSNYQTFPGNVSFPMKIVIKRPTENYLLEMNIEKAEINKALDASTFTLERPSGVDDVDLNTGKDIKP